MNQIHILDHPIASYWLTVLRDRHTPPYLFRQGCSELSSILAYEAFRDLTVKEKSIETPLEITVGSEIDQAVYVVPIMRTGQILIDGVLRTYPMANVLPIGIRRNEQRQPTEYDSILFKNEDRLFCFIVDGIVSTGGTLSRALNVCKRYWPRARYSAISFIGLKNGLEFVISRHPDVTIFVAAYDREESAQGYVLPGIGEIRRRASNSHDIELQGSNLESDLMMNDWPKISGFEKSGIISNSDVSALIFEYLPQEHLELISEIRYVDKYYSLVTDQPLENLLASGLNVTSRWTRDEKSEQEIIEVFQQDLTGNTDITRIKSNIIHEVGHSVYNRLPEVQKATYLMIWQSDKGLSFNIRTQNDVEEDFCHTYTDFFLSRKKLNSTYPDKHNFVRVLAEGVS